MSSVMAQYWIDQSHKVIPSGYASAIEKYSSQKEVFLNNLQKETGLVIDNFITQVNTEIANATTEELDATFNAAFDAVKMYVEEYVVQLMDGANPSYEALVKRFEQVVNKGEAGTINSDNLYKNLQKDIENFLTINNVTRSGLAKYVNQQSGLSNTSNTDIQNNLFGYARKLILQQLRGQELNYSTQHYKTSLKGYYKEELLVPALNKILAQYGIKAAQMGSSRNEVGQQIKYDIILGTVDASKLDETVLNPMIKQMEMFANTVDGNGSVVEYTPKLMGGLQSKSWVAPWSMRSIGGNRNFLSFGHNIGLMPQGEAAHYWHAGVYNVMNNLTTAIGPSNFLFSTGDTVYWTADLLAEFRERQYVLAFYYNKTEGKITSGSITAQPHND